nr:MAG: replication associated protein [Cressdnaviricota sp.]
MAAKQKGKQERDWCLTWNFQGDLAPTVTLRKGHKYICWTRERGIGSDHDHLQMYVMYKSPATLETVCRSFPGCHAESRKGTVKQARDYAMKHDDTYVSGPWELGDYEEPPGQGTRTDLEAACDLVRTSGITSVAQAMPVMFVKYERGLRSLANIYAPRRTWAMDVRVYYGDAGLGKTRMAFEEFPGAYFKDPTTTWWDGYAGEECVIIDDFYGTLPFSYMQRLLDRYPLQVQIKGGSVNFTSKVIIITSNAPWEHWYASKFEKYPAVKKSFERRITQIKMFT